MFGDFTTIEDTTVDIQDGYLVITRTGTQSKDGLLGRYEVKKKYTVKDGFFVEVEE